MIAGTKELVIPSGNWLLLAPPVINKDYYSIEFGFLSEKKIKTWNYGFSAYANATIFQDWLKQSANLKAGGLGFKGGVVLPTQPWVPLFFVGGFGYAKTALHENPLFGRETKSVAKKDMVLLEIGALYRYKKFIMRWTYQKSNVKYFVRNTFLTLGWYY